MSGSAATRRLIVYAPVAQLDRAPGYEPGGREFESLRAHQFINVRSGYINNELYRGRTQITQVSERPDNIEAGRFEIT
jgi:hypothetical protein